MYPRFYISVSEDFLILGSCREYRMALLPGMAMAGLGFESFMTLTCTSLHGLNKRFLSV